MIIYIIVLALSPLSMDIEADDLFIPSINIPC